MAKGNFIEYVVSDNPNKYPNDGEQSGYYYEAVEDVTSEVTTQTPIINQILEGLVGKAQGANATADKILESYSAYVGQELVEGTFKPIIGIDFGEVTLASSTTEITIEHGLGVVPSFVLILEKNTKEPSVQSTFGIINGYSLYKYGGNLSFISKDISKTDKQIIFSTFKTDCPLLASDYIWIAIA